jgi:hypothetical protein
MTDAISEIRMKCVAHENEFPGENAQKVPSGPVAGTPIGAKSAVQEGEGPVRLDCSWKVAPAQTVAILDLTGQQGGRDLAPLASKGPVAPAGFHDVSCNRCPTPAAKI